MSVTGPPDYSIQLSAARRLASSSYPAVDPTSFHSVRFQGDFLGWSFLVGAYPEGRFGFVALDGAVSPVLYELRVHARRALCKQATPLKR